MIWVGILIGIGIGSILGWFASHLSKKASEILKSLKDLKKVEEDRDKQAPGIVRPGIITEKGKITKLPGTPLDDSPIVRSPSPREFARQQLVDEQMEKKL